MTDGIFEPSLPVKPDYFVGRTSEIDRFKKGIERGLSSGRTVSFAVLGDWGIGKSSLLLKYLSLLEKDHKGTTIGIDFTVTKEMLNFYMFSQALLDRYQLLLIKESIPLPQKIKEGIRKWKIDKVELFGISAQKNERYFLSSGSSLLQHSFREIWNDFLVPAKIKQVVIFLDDLHLLEKGERDHIMTLRNIFQSLAVEGYNYNLVFSAKKDYFGRIRELAEPASRFFEKFYLTEFSEEETELLFTKDLELANIKVKISHKVIEKIFHLAKGHPYFVSFIGRCLLDFFPAGNIDITDFNRMWPKIFKILSESKFQEDIRGINGKQMHLLKEMSLIDKDTVMLSDLKKEYQNTYFTRSVRSGILARHGRGEYSLYHPLFKEYLKTIA